MAKRTLQENINQVINDLNEIKSAIETKGVEVPAGTPTRDYGEKILNIETGVDVSADTVVAAALRAGFTAHEASGAAITGTIQNYEGAIVSGATPGAQAKYEEGYADGQASMPDLSKDTVTPDKLVFGETAHDASGAQITGTLDTEAIRAEGVEAGKKSEHDAFWDAYQENGARKNYLSAFAGAGWSKLNIFPKYNMHVENAVEMFFHHAENYGGHYDLVEHLEKQGIDLDFSQCSNYYSAFAYACIRRIGVVNFSSIKDGSYALGNAFIGSYIVTLDKIIVSEETAFTNSTFQNCKKLTNLTIEGTIGQNGFNVSWSPLNKASLTSIVNALSSTTTGLTITLRLDAVNTAFETSEGLADGSTSEEWLALAATKPNWTINLINS